MLLRLLGQGIHGQRSQFRAPRGCQFTSPNLFASKKAAMSSSSKSCCRRSARRRACISLALSGIERQKHTKTPEKHFNVHGVHLLVESLRCVCPPVPPEASHAKGQPPAPSGKETALTQKLQAGSSSVSGAESQVVGKRWGSR